MKIDPIFFEVFTSYFHVDLVDLDNTKQLQKDAGFCAFALSKRIHDLDSLIRDLSQFLNEWHPKMVIRFIEATDTDWFFDEQTERLLRYIITEIIEGLKYYRLPRTWLAGEEAKQESTHL